MIAAAAMLGYAALLLATAPQLARAGWTDRAPRLAIAAWLALTYSAVASAVLAGLAPLIPAHRLGGPLAWLSTACEAAVNGHPGGPVLAVAGGVLTAAVAARMTWCAAATLAASARASRRHRRRLRLAGHRDERLGALVVDHAEPAAYCLPGTRQPVVVTTGALRLLDDTQLAAVVAHERAHQAGRHHLLVALAALPAAAFGRVPAFRLARDEIARLAELAADDAATARSPRLAVAGALLALGCSAPARTPALGAGGSTAAARVRRLIAAPDPLSRAASTAGGLAVAVLSAFPLVLLAVPACCFFRAGYL